MDELIRVNDLSKSYGSIDALEAVSLTLDRQEVIAVIGPSGGGKSTLLRCLNALERFDSGSIWYEHLDDLEVRGGEAVRKADLLRIRRDVGLVFQHGNLWLHRTVEDNLTLGLRVVQGVDLHEARERAVILLERFGLRDKLRDWAWKLSGGQRQRVAIIRALLMKPRVVLLDEVTSALDPTLVGEVLEMLRQLRGDGFSMIVVTHHLEFARRAADRVIVLDAGRIVDRGNPDDVLREDRSAFMKKYLGVLRLAT